MSETSRRKFLAATGAGVAGVAVVGVAGGTADAATRRHKNAATDPVVAYVRSPARASCT